MSIGNSFEAYIISRAYDLDPSIARKKRATESYLAAVAGAGVTITQTVLKDWSAETFTDSVTLAPDGTETRVRRRFEQVDVADAVVLQIKLGDPGTLATSPGWTLDRWVGMLEVQEGAK